MYNHAEEDCQVETWSLQRLCEFISWSRRPNPPLDLVLLGWRVAVAGVVVRLRTALGLVGLRIALLKTAS